MTDTKLLTTIVMRRRMITDTKFQIHKNTNKIKWLKQVGLSCAKLSKVWFTLVESIYPFVNLLIVDI